MKDKGQIIPSVVRLYRADDLYSDEANDFADRAREILRQLFDVAEAGGFSYRDLAHILTGEVSQLESEYQIRRGLKAHESIYPRPKFSSGGQNNG